MKNLIKFYLISICFLISFNGFSKKTAEKKYTKLAASSTSSTNSLLNDTIFKLPASLVYEYVSKGVVKLNHSELKKGTHFVFQLSLDGEQFITQQPVSIDHPNIVGLFDDTTYFIKVQLLDSVSNAQTAFSELLCVQTNQNEDSILIVNGFDRPLPGNDSSYCVRHAQSLRKYNRTFISCNNEAITNGLIDLQDFKLVVYILGEEGTANESFSTEEQELVKSYLDNGGSLMVSGSEIGWDLEKRGSRSDKYFYNRYLKAHFIEDAPNNKANNFYSAIFVPDASGVFNIKDTLVFDDGKSGGSYNVRYPDVIEPTDGAVRLAHYENSPKSCAAIYYKGFFPKGNKIGYLVYMGFPFESVVSDSLRFGLMQNVLSFMYKSAYPQNLAERKARRQIAMPIAKETKYNLRFKGFANGIYTLTISDLNGKLLKTSEINFNQGDIPLLVDDLKSGTYLVKLQNHEGLAVYEDKLSIMAR